MKRKNYFKKNIWTILIIGKGGKTKEIHIHKIGFVSLICLIVFMLGGLSVHSVNLYHKNNNIEKAYNDKISKILDLEEETIKKENELNQLKTKSEEIEQKLIQLNVLEAEVKDLVGIESEEGNVTNREAKRFLLAPDGENDVDYEMDELSYLIDQEKENLKLLKTDVEAKFEYLEAKPNLEPTKGRLTSPFGFRNNPLGKGKEFHNGIDIANTRGTEIFAAGSGIVTTATYKPGFGNIVIINHGYGYQSVYAHNKKILVEKGQEVKKGDNISLMGNSGRSTGSHLHFEVRLNGEPIDPQKVLNNND